VPDGARNYHMDVLRTMTCVDGISSTVSFLGFSSDLLSVLIGGGHRKAVGYFGVPRHEDAMPRGAVTSHPLAATVSNDRRL